MIRVYVIISINDITDTMVEESLNDPASIKRSIDGTQAILKFDSFFPDTVEGYVKYNHEEIMVYLTTNTVDWNVGI